MNLQTSLKGRLRNTNLPKSHALLPLFEAVVNSIHSIDDRIEKQKDITIEDARIRIVINRSSQTTIDGSKPELTGFTIEDNGIGFNSENYNSFQTLDSDHKMDRGCRGIGRLLWLKAYRHVIVNSSYKDCNKHFIRTFQFDALKDISNENFYECSNDEIKTTISLCNISNQYYTGIPKTTNKIANALLEHCLWYFLRDGSAPSITLEDLDDSISLNRIYDDYMINAATAEEILIKDEIFEIIHVKCRLKSETKNTISYVAANRLVKSESIKGTIPGLFGTLKDEEEFFYYMCFVASSYLTDNVTPERLGFNIPERAEGVYADTEISQEEIKEKILENISAFLDPYLTENKTIGRTKMREFIDKKAPRYRPILNRLAEEDMIVDPEISDKDLELKLHKHLMVIENEVISEGHDLMKPIVGDDIDSYSEKIEAYLSKVTDLKKSDLANYVSHRKVVLDLLEKALEIQPDGKYIKEDVIHKLIMPMVQTSDNISSDEYNLWLIDERLSFHHFLASDKTINSMPITESNSTKEPDILALNIYDNPLLVNEGSSLPLASITVIELKRPMRNDAKEGEDKNPIEQTLGYLKRIRSGNVQMQNGRPIPNSNDIPGFCYVICDLTSKMVERCEFATLKQTSDKLGYFGYNNNYNAYIEVISFDQLLNNAKQRNRAFFDKLGLPTT